MNELERKEEGGREGGRDFYNIFNHLNNRPLRHLDFDCINNPIDFLYSHATF